MEKYKSGVFMSEFDYIKRNYDALCEHIAKISARVGVPKPTLVCVTKSGSDDELLALLGAGAEDIGENRPQELHRRGELLLANGFSPRLHEIGNLQSNKAKLIAPIAALTHSLDSHSLAKALEREGEKLGRKIPVLIEVNSAREEQKGGVLPEDAERFLNELSAYQNLEVRGLMTMGPAECSGDELRGYFALTKKLFDDLNSRYGFGADATLSMGMSDSYECAIEEGSTLVRVGRRLFIKN